MAHVGRIIAITLGLSAAGVVFGGIAGALALALSLAIGGSFDLFSHPAAFAVPAALGAVIGAIGAPAMAWLLLRHVPLGKAVAWSTLGTVAGAVVGWTVAVALHDATPWLHTSMGDEVKGAILGALVGFLVAAFVLRRRASVDKVSPLETGRTAA
jgi:hypothetical protein